MIKKNLFVGVTPTTPASQLQRLADAAKAEGDALTRDVCTYTVNAARHPTSTHSQPNTTDGKGSSLNAFEEHIAELLGKEAAMFCVSGVMAQLIALAVYREQTGGRSKFIIHESSHIHQHENMVQLAVSSSPLIPTLNEHWPVLLFRPTRSCLAWRRCL